MTVMIMAKKEEHLNDKKLRDTKLPEAKIVRVKIGETIGGDVLPDVGKILDVHIKQKTKYWGTRWKEMLGKPETQKDLLFGSFVDLEETALRIQAVLIRKTINYEFLKIYLQNISNHITRINSFLEDIQSEED